MRTEGVRPLAAAVGAVIFLLGGLRLLRSAENPLKLARQAFDIADYANALRYLNQALADDPDREGVRALKGYAFYKLGQADQALGELRKERERFPRNEEGWLLAAAVAWDKGDRDAAEALSRDYVAAFGKEIRKRKAASSIAAAVKASPNGGIPSYILARGAAEQGQYGEAEARFREALRLGYDQAASRAGLAGLALKGGRFEDAGRAIAETRDPALKESAEVLTLEALAKQGIGRDEEALSLFAAAAETEPFEDWTVRNYAAVLVERGKFDQAVERLNGLLRIFPADFRAKELLEAAEHRRIPDSDSSLVKIDSEFPRFNKTIYRYIFYQNTEILSAQVQVAALDLIRAGESEIAIDFMSRFVGLFGSAPAIEYNLAQLLNGRDARLEALRHAWKAISLRPDFRDAWDLCANVLFKAADYRGAVGFYGRAALLDPGDSQGQFNLGCAQYAVGDLASAEASFREVIKLDASPAADAVTRQNSATLNPLSVNIQVKVNPVTVPAYLNLARIYGGSNREEMAIESLVLAIRLAPKTKEPYFELGKLRLARGEIEAAAECFTKYVDLGGDAAKVKSLQKK